MDINRKSMDVLFQGFNTNFLQGMNTPPVSWQKFCGIIPSGTSSNVYPFLEQFGGMREWIGERVIKNLASKKLEVVNRDFEETVAVAGNDIEDDQYGIYSTLIAQMGSHAARLWHDLAVEALTGNPLWADDIPFFSTERLYGENPVKNLSPEVLSHSVYASARMTMMNYRGHNNKNLGIIPNLLIVGPKNEETAFGILKDRLQLRAVNENNVSGIGTAGNPWNGSAELLVLPELSGEYEDNWYLAATDGVLKPLFVQQRKMPSLVRLDSEGDENVFCRKEYIYGTNARGAAFLAFPHLIYRGGCQM
ncbi:MAG: Mu-like prophage major head subunit gpT family protein [Lentisphaeria bacterium]|nr:Mu-like prophage major head subunit gpT family protein [Lentisphaeria bacterium]